MRMQAVAGGPRATDRFAAVTAAFVSGLAGTSKSSEVVAFFLEAAASRMEAAMKVRHVSGNGFQDQLSSCAS